MIIDAHAHVGRGRYKSLAAEDLLAQMDEAGVDGAVICPVEEQIVVENRAGNESMLALMKAYPSRLFGFAVANPWFGGQAEEELARALANGLRGLKLHPVIQGFSPNDPIVYPLIEMAARAGVPVYIHSGTAHYGEPFKVAELARRYPEVTFILGHAGASDFWYDLPRCRQFAPNLLFETSRNGPANYHNMMLNLGAEAIVFGSNVPESLYSLELASVRDVVVEQEDLDRVLGLNIARALGEVGYDR